MTSAASPRRREVYLLVVVINQSQMWVKSCLVFLSFHHNPWRLPFKSPQMRLLPSFWNKTKETWRCLSARCSILNADQDPHVLVDFAESPTGPAVLTPGHGHGGQVSSWRGFCGAKARATLLLFLPPTQSSSKCLKQMHSLKVFSRPCCERESLKWV